MQFPVVRPRVDAFLAAILFFVLLAFLPMLMYPHWGLLSDPEQIVQNGRRFALSPSTNLELLRGPWRPVAHSADMLMFFIFGDHPSAFFFLNYILFSFALVFIYKSSLLLTKSRLISFGATAMSLTSAASFETITTLDKGESKLVFFLSASTFLFLKIESGFSESSYTLKLPKFRREFMLLFLSILFAFFTKESSRILLLSIFIIPTAIFLNGKTKVGAQRSGWLYLYAGCAFVSFLLFKIFYYSTGGAADTVNYASVQFSISETIESLRVYWRMIPEIMVLVSFCALMSALGLGRVRKLSFSEFDAIFLTLLSLFGLTYLVNYRWKLNYICLPFLAFLLPASAFHFKTLMTKFDRYRKAAFVFSAVLFLVWLGFSVPKRIFEVSAQLAMDRSTDMLASEMVRVSSATTRFALPFFDPSSAEIGERVEFYFKERSGEIVKRDRILNYFKRKNSHAVSLLEKMSQLPEHFEDGLDPNTSSLLAVEFRNTDYEDLLTFVGAELWVTRVRKGDNLLVPTGCQKLAQVSYRAVGLFAVRSEDFLMQFPELKFQKKFSFSNKVRTILSRKACYIGWDAYEVVGFN